MYGSLFVVVHIYLKKTPRMRALHILTLENIRMNRNTGHVSSRTGSWSSVAQIPLALALSGIFRVTVCVSTNTRGKEYQDAANICERHLRGLLHTSEHCRQIILTQQSAFMQNYCNQRGSKRLLFKTENAPVVNAMPVSEHIPA